MTNSVGEVKNTEVFFVIGSNTTENHPVIGAQVRQALAKGAKLIVADPREIDLAKDADVYLQIRPGTNIALLNGMMHVIIKEDLIAKEYIKQRTVGYEELVEIVKDYTPEKVAEICNVVANDIVKAARIYASKPASILYAMGVTQHKYGTNGVMTLSNLALICGNIGIENAGVNPLRGQGNVQGACDMGGLPDVYPGYQKVFDEQANEKFAKAWNKGLPLEPGLTIPEMIEGANDGTVKMLYIMGENPMVSDPDISHVKSGLNNLDFLVVQDIFLTETAELADIILPAAAFAEKDGTFTNTERRIQKVNKILQAPGEAKSDWLIMCELAKVLGDDFSVNSAEEIMEEIASLTPIYGGVSYKRLNNVSLQWPCTSEKHPGTKYLHKGEFSRGKAKIIPIDFVESDEAPTKEYPFLMTTGRNLYHYHTRTMTGKTAGNNQKSPHSYVEINPTTAKKLGIENDDWVVVSSPRGEVKTQAKITEIIGEQVVFMPFHFAEGAANYITNTNLDEIAKIPELKVNAVNVKKVD
jgi:formate dehydrogenase major subunit